MRKLRDQKEKLPSRQFSSDPKKDATKCIACGYDSGSYRMFSSVWLKKTGMGINGLWARFYSHESNKLFRILSRSYFRCSQCVSCRTVIANDGESYLQFVIIAMRTMQFIRETSWERKKKSAYCSQMGRGDKGYQGSKEKVSKEINMSPKGHLLLNNKYPLRKMKINEQELRAKVDQNNSMKWQEISTKEMSKHM